jgi:hypothetical protein
MTSLICVAQPRRGIIHFVTDAALYQNRIVTAFGTKTTTIPQWPGIVSTAGNAAAASLFAHTLSQQFATWDDLIEGQTELSHLSGIVEAWGLSHATILLAGVSAARGPEAFTFQTTTTPPPGVSAEEYEADPYFADAYKLVKLPDVIATPVPPFETVLAANFDGIDLDADPELIVWSMRKVLAMQRHMSLPNDIGGIGGFAELTTISADGITQRIIQHWPEDKIGAALHHGPIDWDRWHAANPKPETKLRVV